MPKYRPWLDDIDSDIRHITAQGIDNVLNSRGIDEKPLEFPGLKPISNLQLSTLFFMYLLGNLAALMTFGFENLRAKNNPR